MKRLFLLFAIYFMPIAVLAQTTQTGSDYIGKRLQLTLSNAPQPVPNASVFVSGNPGPVTYYYWIVTQTSVGASTPAGPFQVINAPNALSASNFNQISWTTVSGATYDVLRTNNPGPPFGACNCAVATAVAGNSVSDQSNNLNAYTVNTLDPSTKTVTLQNVNGALTPGLPLNGSSINSVLWVDGSTYTTIAACYAALVPGGTCMVPPNYLETLSANLILNKKKTTIQFTGGCAITLGAFNVQVAQGADDISIITPFVHSSDQAGSNQGCMFGGYTGSGAAIDIGSSAGFTYNTLIRGVAVDLSSAAPSAIGIRRTNEVAGALAFDEVVGGSVSGQIGFQFVGTGALFDGTSPLIDLECNYSASSTNGKCLQFTGTNQNGYSFVGGHSNTGGSANGSVCIDAGAGSSKIDLGGFYCDVAATAVTVESTANTAVRGWLIVDSGVTLVANFATGSNGNRIETNTRSIGTQLVTDNGTANTNSVSNGFDLQFNSRRWRIVSETGGSGFQILDQSDNSQAIAKGVGGATHIDSSAGNPVRFGQNTGSGIEVWNNTAATFVVDSNGTPHPAAVNAVGLGTTALPFLNLKIGNAATNNTTWSPVTTGARTLTSPDGNSSTVIPFSFTTTAAATDNVTVTGMTSSGHCSLTATNSAAAAGIASVFVSGKAANQITVTHTATSGWTFDGFCTSN